MSMNYEGRAVLARRFFTGTGNNAPPGSGATITLFDSAVNTTANLDCLPYNRIQVNVYSSHDSAASGVVFNSSFDQGAHFRQQSTQSYTNATGPASWDYNMKGANVQVTYQNSANVLTAFEMEVVGIYDRNPGV